MTDKIMPLTTHGAFLRSPSKWFKYLIEERSSVILNGDLRNHSLELSGSTQVTLPQTKEEFYRQYLKEFQLGRINQYFEFLVNRIPQNSRVLSIASGFCALEMRLKETKGIDILCTDLVIHPWLNQLRELFPDLVFKQMDALNTPNHSEASFDAVVATGLIYLFDLTDLNTFLANASKLLKADGKLYLELPGPPPGLITRVFHNIFLPIEAVLVILWNAIIRRKIKKIVKLHFGYHHDASAVISLAETHSLYLEDTLSSGFLNDWQRSVILSRLIRRSIFIKRFFNLLGKRNPYIRLFVFKRR